MFKSEKGQSIVLIAAILVGLIAFATLAMDAGNLYTARREAQNAADAAAMAGARQIVLECSKGAGADESAIRNQALQMVAGNIQNGTAQVYYINDSSAHAFSSEIGGVGYVPCACGGNKASGVEVTVVKNVPSFVGTLISNGGVAGATARARFSPVANVTTGLYPFTRRNMPIEKNQLVTLRILDDADTMPGNFGWLSWNGDNNVPNLCESLTPPGDSGTKYYNPGTPANNWTADYGDKQINIGDWVQGAPGNKNADCVRNWLDYFIANKAPLTIPLYDTVAEQGSKGNYRVASFAAFELQSYDLTGQTKSMTGKFIDWVTPGDWAPPVPCGSGGGVVSVKLVP